MKNLFAHTGPSTEVYYPEFISVNETPNGGVEIHVRNAGTSAASAIVLTAEQRLALAKALAP